MHIKTGWTPRDYLDLYVTDDGEPFDLVQGRKCAASSGGKDYTGTQKEVADKWI